MPNLALPALLVLASSTASANVVAVDESTAVDEPRDRRLEGRLGMLLGGSDVGDADGFSLGVSAGAGYRIGDVTLRALFDHYRVGDGGDEAMDRRGRGTRVGGAVRYAFVSSSAREPAGRRIGFDVWGELGVGYEHVTWRRGGVLDRPSGEAAVGFELDAQGKAERGRRRHVGYFMAFRTLIGQGPETSTPPMCGGPCTKATRPSRTDFSMFFELGLHWGR